MQAIVLISGAYTPAEAIAQGLAERTGYPLVLDEALVTGGAEKLNISPQRFNRILFGQPARWGLPPRPRRRATAVAAIREIMAAMLLERPAIFCGHLGLLLPQRLATRVMVHAELPARLAIALKSTGSSEAGARTQIQAADERLYALTHYLRQRDMEGDCDQDLGLQTDRLDVEAAVGRILSHMAGRMKAASGDLDAARRDFVLGASIERRLAAKGYVVQADVRGDDLALTLDQPALWLSHTLARVKRLCASLVPDRTVRIRIGRGYHQDNICHPFDFRTPRRVVFKKEERWFAQQCAGGQEGASPASAERPTDLPPGAWV